MQVKKLDIFVVGVWGSGYSGLFLMSVSIDADAGTDVCLSLGSCSG